MSDIAHTLRTLTTECIAAGAQAVVLFGSLARGDATPQSDIDVMLFGTGTNRYEWYAGRLLVANWTTPTAARAPFTDPGAAPTVIPGWREAQILHDPDGTAAALQSEAHTWTWDQLDPQAVRAHIAASMAELAEEVLKLAAALRDGRRTMAAVQRNLLVLNMAGIPAVQRRVLYSSENVLWDLLAAEMGDPWAATQARAFGLHGETFDDTCRAALELYALTASETETTFDDQQRRIIVAVTRYVHTR